MLNCLTQKKGKKIVRKFCNFMFVLNIYLTIIINIILELKIYSSFEEIMTMKKSKFQKIVTKKLKAEALNYLKNKIKSKWSKIDYGERLEK